MFKIVLLMTVLQHFFYEIIPAAVDCNYNYESDYYIDESDEYDYYTGNDYIGGPPKNLCHLPADLNYFGYFSFIAIKGV